MTACRGSARCSAAHSRSSTGRAADGRVPRDLQLSQTLGSFRHWTPKKQWQRMESVRAPAQQHTTRSSPTSPVRCPPPHLGASCAQKLPTQHHPLRPVSLGLVTMSSSVRGGPRPPVCAEAASDGHCVLRSETLMKYAHLSRFNDGVVQCGGLRLSSVAAGTPARPSTWCWRSTAARGSGKKRSGRRSTATASSVASCRWTSRPCASIPTTRSSESREVDSGCMFWSYYGRAGPEAWPQGRAAAALSSRSSSYS